MDLSAKLAPGGKWVNDMWEELYGNGKKSRDGPLSREDNESYRKGKLGCK